jgi:cytoskeletal protein RodZ
MTDNVKKAHKKHRKNKLKWVKTIMICAIIILIGVNSLIVTYAFQTAKNSAKNAYSSSFEEKKDEVYDWFHETAYKYSEEKYHVKNKATISITQVKETAELEVLQAGASVYNVNEEESRCTLYKGTGVFTVNLKEAEYIIDDERQYVLVRVPSPKLGEVSVDDYEIYEPEYEGNVFQRFVFNGSSSEGVEMAITDRKEGQTMLENKIRTTQLYAQSARTSAESLIQELVKNFNPDVDDLTVEVEFID